MNVHPSTQLNAQQPIRSRRVVPVAWRFAALLLRALKCTGRPSVAEWFDWLPNSQLTEQPFEVVARSKTPIVVARRYVLREIKT